MRRLRLLRAAYTVAAAATAVIGWLAISGRLMKLMFDFGGNPSRASAPMDKTFMTTFNYMNGAGVMAFAGLFLFLSIRPYWWGKLICLWAGLSWLMFAGVGSMMGPFQATVAWVLAAGITMLSAALAIQLTDPRWSGSYLRAMG